jgi:hypothetical protein
VQFLESIPVVCLHDLFKTVDTGARASQAHPAFADPSTIIINRKENAEVTGSGEEAERHSPQVGA